jgi:hypothetical protein
MMSSELSHVLLNCSIGLKMGCERREKSTSEDAGLRGRRLKGALPMYASSVLCFLVFTCRLCMYVPAYAGPCHIPTRKATSIIDSVSKLIRFFKNIQERAMQPLRAALKLASVGMAPLRKHSCLTTSSSSRKQSNQAPLRPNVCLAENRCRKDPKEGGLITVRDCFRIRKPFHPDCAELSLTGVIYKRTERRPDASPSIAIFCRLPRSRSAAIGWRDHHTASRILSQDPSCLTQQNRGEDIKMRGTRNCNDYRISLQETNRRRQTPRLLSAV